MSYAGAFIPECPDNPYFSGEHLWATVMGVVRIQNGKKFCRYCEHWFEEDV